MLIEIDEDLFNKIKELMKNRSVSMYEKLEEIKPIEVGTLQKARSKRTQKVIQSIKETIKSLYSEDMKPTKYQIHKRTGIAYVTINKYYDEIVEEVLNESNS
ncbi:MAG: hypothetical protein WA945_01670 [Arcobacteraceae bacterium]